MRYPLLVTLMSACLLIALARAAPVNNAAAQFDRIESLVGQWRGALPDGKSILLTYERLNGGAILERYRSTDPMWWNMSTVYYAGQDRVVMSHYCSWGNHPRMTLEPAGGEADTLDFDFQDMARGEPGNGYMRDLVVEFEDADHIKHHWVWREKGEDRPLTVTFERIR